MTLILDHFWSMFSGWAFGWGGLAAVIGVVLLALWFLTPAFISSPAAKAVLLNAGLGCVAFAFVSGYYTRVGYQKCIDVNAIHDNLSIERAAKAVQAVEACRDSGGRWNVTNGSCEQ